MAVVAEDAIRQVWQPVLLEEPTCEAPFALRMWNPQKCPA
jgi:hypothetical protein